MVAAPSVEEVDDRLRPPARPHTLEDMERSDNVTERAWRLDARSARNEQLAGA
jgi:hypothetical protein